MFNPGKIFRMKNAWEAFTASHPKFPLFLEAVNQNALQEGTIIEFSVTTPDGKTLQSNVKLNKSDVEAIRELTSDLTN